MIANRRARLKLDENLLFQSYSNALQVPIERDAVRGVDSSSVEHNKHVLTKRPMLQSRHLA